MNTYCPDFLSSASASAGANVFGPTGLYRQGKAAACMAWTSAASEDISSASAAVARRMAIVMAPPKADSPARQQSLHQPAGLAEVHLAGMALLERGHDLAHVLHAGGAGLLDHGGDRGLGL